MGQSGSGIDGEELIGSGEARSEATAIGLAEPFT